MKYIKLKKLEKYPVKYLIDLAEYNNPTYKKKDYINYILNNDKIIHKIKKNNEQFIDSCCKYRRYVDITLSRPFNEWLSLSR